MRYTYQEAEEDDESVVVSQQAMVMQAATKNKDPAETAVPYTHAYIHTYMHTYIIYLDIIYVYM
jgi:hypothetical protein